MDTRIRRFCYAGKHKGGEYLNRFPTVMLQLPPADKLNRLNQGEDKHKFNFTPAPSRDDTVIRYLKLLIRDIKKSNIISANLRIRVAPITRFLLFWFLNPARPDFDMKMYTFFDDINEFPLTTCIILVPRINGLRTEYLYANQITSFSFSFSFLSSNTLSYASCCPVA
jgi:hypothetical protein